VAGWRYGGGDAGDVRRTRSRAAVAACTVFVTL